MKEKKVRNGAVELLRFVFTFVIIAAHYKTQYKNSNISLGMNGHTSVEFFFMLSGFLMAGYCARQRQRPSPAAAIATPSPRDGVGVSTWIFMKRKIVAIAPVYYAALYIYVTRYWIVHDFKPIDSPLPVADFFARILPSLLFLPSVGMKEILAITYSWYIGAMMLGMLILYPLVYRFGRNFILLTLPVVIFYSSYAMQTHGALTLIQNEWLLFFFPSLLRGLAGMCLGCISYELCQLLQQRLSGKLTAAGRTLLTLLGLGTPAFLVLWMILQLNAGSTLAVYPLTTVFLVILMSGLDYTSEWFGSTPLGSFCRWLGRLSLPCYLGQGIVRYYYPESLVGGLRGLIPYGIACLAMGAAIQALAWVLTKFWRQLCVAACKVCLQ